MIQAKLTDSEVQKHLDSLNHEFESDWKVVDNKLYKEFIFPDFVRAFGFMSQVAIASESIGNHPEWSNIYNKVIVNLTTHESGGITTLNFKLARKMEKYARGL